MASQKLEQGWPVCYCTLDQDEGTWVCCFRVRSEQAPPGGDFVLRPRGTDSPTDDDSKDGRVPRQLQTPFDPKTRL